LARVVDTQLRTVAGLSRKRSQIAAPVYPAAPILLHRVFGIPHHVPGSGDPAPGGRPGHTGRCLIVATTAALVVVAAADAGGRPTPGMLPARSAA
jgi:hypothetical protein